MAKTTKAVKRSATPSRAKTARSKKATPKKTTQAAKPARKKSTRTAKGNGSSKTLTPPVVWVAHLLPTPLERISYVQRTLSILDDGARKRAHLRKRQVKQLGQVWGDLHKDVQQQWSDVELSTRKRFEGLADKVRDTRVVQEVSDLPERMTETVDVALARVGLIRKSVVLENVGRKALPAAVR